MIRELYYSLSSLVMNITKDVTFQISEFINYNQFYNLVVIQIPKHSLGQGECNLSHVYFWRRLCDNAGDFDSHYLLVKATLSIPMETETILYVSRHPRWPRQVQW